MNVDAPTTPVAPRQPVGDFEHEAPAVVEFIRDRFSAAIEAHCGGAPRAQDVAEAFGLHRKLGWQIWNVAYGPGPLQALQHMPSAKGLDAFRRAVAECGLTADLVGGVVDAAERFDRLVSTHAAERGVLDMMLGSCDARPSEETELRWRKQAYTGNCYVWGVHTKVLMGALLLHPAQRRGYFDMVRLHSLIGLVRTRPQVRWPIAQSVIETAHGRSEPGRAPLHESAAVRRTGVPLVEPFCSKPLPAVERRRGDLGMLEDDLLPGPVGETGGATVVIGEVLRDAAPAYRLTPGETALFGAGIRTPSAVYVYDHFVHRDLFPGVKRELRVFGELVSAVSRDERDRLPVPEELQHLGRGTLRVRTAEVPFYMDLLRLVTERTGWKLSDFDLYRVRMRYPPLPVSVMIQHDLPDAPRAEQERGRGRSGRVVPAGRNPGSSARTRRVRK